jgi:hypothetical protein
MMLAASKVLIYNPPGSADPSWTPTVQTHSKAITPGKTDKVVGTRFNGLSQAMAHKRET